MMRWASIDPANKAGIAYWDGDQLTGTVILKRVGAKGKFSLDGVIFLDRFTAWKDALESCAAIVTEEGCGRFATAIKSQAGIRGYIEAVCDYIRLRKGDATAAFRTVNVSEWRRVIKESYGVSWPATTERKKALSVQLVRQHYGIEATNDEADAVLLGVAAMRMGLVEISQCGKVGEA